MNKIAPREMILSLFHQTPDGFVSGEKMSETLGVSRTAVWKHIRSLREAGYRIEAVPSRGYQLMQTPDVLMPESIQADLGCHLVGSKVVCFDETDSTNVQACRLGDQGAEAGLVVVADKQLAGKGRMGRSWESPEAVNLYLSVLLRPAILPFDAPKMTFLSAVAVCRAINGCSGLSAKVKWPNDVLVHGKKVAGLLNEMSSETEQVHYVVLGIGVNLNMQADQFPKELRYPASSLAIEAGQPLSRLAFARRLLQEIDSLYDVFIREGSRPIMAEWSDLCELTGKPVHVESGHVKIEGIMTGLAEDGALLVRTASGNVETVYAGDVRPA